MLEFIFDSNENVTDRENITDVKQQRALEAIVCVFMFVCV